MFIVFRPSPRTDLNKKDTNIMHKNQSESVNKNLPTVKKRPPGILS
eukprot:UN10603